MNDGPTAIGNFLVVVFLVVLVLCGGGKFIWSQGAFLILVGAVLTFRPPQRTLDRRMDWTVLTLVGLGLIAFLPSDWFGFLPGILFGRPDWWTAADRAGIALPPTISAQPIRSLEALALMCGGIGFFYLLINIRFRGKDRWRLLQLFSILGGLLALAVVYGSWKDINYPITDRAASFSYFDNRNQTSILMGMIGVVSLALIAYNRQTKWYWVAISAFSFFAAATAVSMSLSKAGLILFVIGAGIWTIFHFGVGKEAGALRVVAPLAAICFGLMLITGQQTLSRVQDWIQADESVFDSMRWRIYSDSINMIANQPATGVGLGNFSVLFPQYREHSATPEPVIHPESDWLWVASELGVPGMSVVAALIILLYWLMLPFGRDPSTPIRSGALIALSLVLLHSFFDVSAHRLGIIVIALWLYRIALPRLKSEANCLFPSWIWRFGGIALFAIGGVWVYADTTKSMLHTAVVKEVYPVQIDAAIEAGSADAVLDDLDVALNFLPLDWQLHLYRGKARLYLERDTTEAREDFRKARLLEPVMIDPALYEGEIWLRRSTHYAYEAWADALTRQTTNPQEVYKKIILTASGNPRFSRDLDRLSQTSSAFRTRYLESLQGKNFLKALSDDLRRSSTLSQFSGDEREAIMLMWLDRGDAGALIRFLESAPDSIPNAWYYQANAMAKLGNFPGAIELAAEYVPVPQIPAMQSLGGRPIDEQRVRFAAQPDDVVRGGMLLNQQLKNQDLEGAKWTLERLLAIDKPPVYAYYWMGEIDRLEKRYREAWQHWKEYTAQVVERDLELKTAATAMFEDIDDARDNPLLWELVEPFEKRKN
ncbi:MAG: O-antigen ligase family protein [Verrucomicrobiota bacterium]